MKIVTYICTYNRPQLALGAAQSLRKNLLDTSFDIILVCGIGDADKFSHSYYSDIIENPFINPNIRRRGFLQPYRHSLNNKNDLSLCIDDDIRLIEPISLQDRYPDVKYIPDNTFCVQIWKDPYYQLPKHLKVQRLNRINNFKGNDKKLAQLAVNNWSEQIDNVWLHIDKGSEKMTEHRKNLIDYLDHD